MHRRTVVSIPCGPSALAVKEAAWGLARYAAISQVFLCAYFYLHFLFSYNCIPMISVFLIYLKICW